MKRSRVALAVAFLAVGGASAAVAAPNASGSTPDRRSSTISGRAWVDTDGNGSRAAGESGIEGVTVSLELVPERRIIKTVTTASEGRYSFGRLESKRCYRIRMTVPDGRVPTSRDVGSDATDSDLNGEGVVPRWVCPGWGWYSVKNIDGGFAAAPTPSSTVKLEAKLFLDANRSLTIDSGDPLAQDYLDLEPLVRMNCGTTPIESEDWDSKIPVKYAVVGDTVEAELPRGATCYWLWMGDYRYGPGIEFPPIDDGWRSDALSDMLEFRWRVIDTNPPGDVVTEQILMSAVVAYTDFVAYGPLDASDADVAAGNVSLLDESATTGYSVRLQCGAASSIGGPMGTPIIVDTTLWSGGDPLVLSITDTRERDFSCVATYASGPSTLGEIEPGLFVYDRAPIPHSGVFGIGAFVQAESQPYANLGVTLWEFETYLPTPDRSVIGGDPRLLLSSNSGISAG